MDRIVKAVFYSEMARCRTAFLNVSEVLDQYLETALWSSSGDNDDYLDENYSIEDISSSFKRESEKDCRKFISEAEKNLSEEQFSSLEGTNVGHDFWLTRNGHGAGFWDGDYEKEVGEILTKLSKKFGEVTPYVGDDGKIYGG